MALADTSLWRTAYVTSVTWAHESARFAGKTLRQREHAADAGLLLHQLEPAVDLVEREGVRHERFDVDLSGQPAVDERRDAVAALHAAERRPRDAPAGDQQARHDVERLALARHARDRAQAPAHARR